jgi:hypothetical protein
MRKVSNRYEYYGPVYSFDNKLITPHWYGQTYAPSVEKARSNLEFQYKKKHGYTPNASIHLNGEIVMVI